MSGLNEKYKNVFIHIPKCAGSSMSDLKITSGGKGHDTLNELYKKNPTKVKNYFKWTFIRNPFERIASAFFSFGRETDTEKEIIEEHRKAITEHDRTTKDGFIDFINRLPIYADRKDCIHFKPIGYFIDDCPNLKIDFIGKFENLSSDWRKLRRIFMKNFHDAEYLVLPHKNKSPMYRTSAYLGLYDDENTSKDIIKKLYEKEIKEYYPEFLCF